VKDGNLEETVYILKEMGYPVSRMERSEEDEGELAWGRTASVNDSIYEMKASGIKEGIVPNVCGMGAKDAVFLMQQCNLNVEISGYGTVKSQSIAAGTRVKEKRTVRLTLAP
jgi:cell division protein FtsI (penicillin-binding protein 3)